MNTETLIKWSSRVLLLTLISALSYYAYFSYNQARRSFIMNLGVAYSSFVIDKSHPPESVGELAEWICKGEKRTDVDAFALELQGVIAFSKNEPWVILLSKRDQYLQADLNRLIKNRLTKSEPTG